MRFLFWKSERKKDCLVLDIGKEAIKSLLFVGKGQDIELGAWALEYFDDYNFPNLDEDNVIKKVIARIFQKPEFKKLPKKILLSLPPSILKGRIALPVLLRKNSREIIRKKEAELLKREALAEAKEKISDLVFEEFGILQKEIRFTSVSVLEIKIDGYSVPSLEGYKGKDIDFRILVIFALKEPLKRFENIFDVFKFKEREILHSSQGLSRLQITGAENSIFLEVGGSDTQIFLIKNAKLEQIGDFSTGGKAFSQKLSEALGQRDREGRELKERYSRGELGIEVKNRVEEILEREQINWYKNLKEIIKKINPSGLLPLNFYLFGGGSQLPEIQRILETGDWQGVRSQIFSLKGHCNDFGFKREKLPFPILNNPQYTPGFLLFHARKNF